MSGFYPGQRVLCIDGKFHASVWEYVNAVPLEGEIYTVERIRPRARDYDARACYVIYHPAADRVVFRRIPYDIKKAQARFLEAGLSDFDAERIAMGS